MARSIIMAEYRCVDVLKSVDLLQTTFDEIRSKTIDKWNGQRKKFVGFHRMIHAGTLHKDIDFRTTVWSIIEDYRYWPRFETSNEHNQVDLLGASRWVPLKT